MVIIDEHIEKIYLVSGHGLFVRIMQNPRGTVTIIDEDPTLWILEDHMREERRLQAVEELIMRLNVYWCLAEGDTIRGSFDGELYKRVLKAKNLIP